jgi:hypothetical protein
MMATLLSLPVELITQIALETSKVFDRDFFAADSIRDVMHPDHTVQSMALVCKCLYATLRHLRFHVICVRLCRKISSKSTCDWHGQRIDYILSSVPAGAVDSIQIMGTDGGAISPECFKRHKQLFTSPALRNVMTLGLVNVQSNAALLHWLPRDKVETLLIFELQHDGFFSRIFTSAMCTYLASFPPLKCTRLMYRDEHPIENAYVLDRLNLQALRIFCSPPFTHIAPLLGLTMMEIEYSVVSAMVLALNNADCELQHLRILFIFVQFQRFRGSRNAYFENNDDPYSDDLPGLVRRCPKLEELCCKDMDEACMRSLMESLPTTLEVLSGDIYHFSSVYRLIDAIISVAPLRADGNLLLDLDIDAHFLRSSIENYLRYDGSCRWLPRLPMLQKCDYTSEGAFENAYWRACKETVDSTLQILGRALRQSLD